MPILAKLTPAQNAHQPDKPLIGALSFVVPHKGQLREVLRVRTYMGASASASVVYACLWARPADGAAEWHSGRGNASGYGYHKESAAIASAFRSAGVEMTGYPDSRYVSTEKRTAADKRRSFDFGGTGSSYYPDVFRAVSRALGYSAAAVRRGLIVSHG